MRKTVKKRLWKQASLMALKSQLTTLNDSGTLEWVGFKRIFRDLKRDYRPKPRKPRVARLKFEVRVAPEIAIWNPAEKIIRG
jgi:hypothetical protein